jgi:hypothetical protein
VHESRKSALDRALSGMQTSCGVERGRRSQRKARPATIRRSRNLRPRPPAASPQPPAHQGEAAARALSALILGAAAVLVLRPVLATPPHVQTVPFGAVKIIAMVPDVDAAMRLLRTQGLGLAMLGHDSQITVRIGPASRLWLVESPHEAHRWNCQYVTAKGSARFGPAAAPPDELALNATMDGPGASGERSAPPWPVGTSTYQVRDLSKLADNVIADPSEVRCAAPAGWNPGPGASIIADRPELIVVLVGRSAAPADGPDKACASGVIWELPQNTVLRDATEDLNPGLHLLTGKPGCPVSGSSGLSDGRLIASVNHAGGVVEVTDQDTQSSFQNRALLGGALLGVAVELVFRGFEGLIMSVRGASRRRRGR